MCAGAVVSDPHDDASSGGCSRVPSDTLHAPLWNEKRVENSERERERERDDDDDGRDRERFRTGSQYYSRMDEKNTFSLIFFFFFLFFSPPHSLSLSHSLTLEKKNGSVRDTDSRSVGLESSVAESADDGADDDAIGPLPPLSPPPVVRDRHHLLLLVVVVVVVPPPLFVQILVVVVVVVVVDGFPHGHVLGHARALRGRDSRGQGRVARGPPGRTGRERPGEGGGGPRRPRRRRRRREGGAAGAGGGRGKEEEEDGRGGRRRGGR